MPPLITPDLSPPDRPRRALTILLAEDNSINRKFMTALLNKHGHRVVTAVNGQEAIDRVMEGGLDVVLMDVQMPVMDGVSATRRIRELQNEMCRIPIIALTAHALAGDRDRCIQAGMNDYVAKPVAPGRLFSALSQWVEPAPSLSAASASCASQGETAPDPSDFPSMEGIDVRSGVNRMEGNVAPYLRLWQEFMDQFADSAKTLRRSLRSRQFEQAGRLMHAVRGAAGNLGANELHEIARDIEEALQGEQGEGLLFLAKRFDRCLRVVMKSANRLSGELSGRAAVPSPPPPVDGMALNADEWHAELMELNRLIGRHDIGAMATCIDLRKKIADPELGQALEGLGSRLEVFEFEAAQANLIEIARHLGISDLKGREP
jgi:CheY-like chemotaxis protein/HPt (histidine-containing phosphotransfer) domain-containing protein